MIETFHLTISSNKGHSFIFPKLCYKLRLRLGLLCFVICTRWKASRDHPPSSKERTFVTQASLDITQNLVILTRILLEIMGSDFRQIAYYTHPFDLLSRADGSG